MDTDDSIFDELKQPKNWAYMATALQKAASLMDYTTKRDITDWQFIPIYRMLIGFSLENLIKGILVAEGHPCMNDGARLHHRLAEYAALVKGITLDGREKKLIDDVEHYAVWAGRYPRPLNPKRKVRIGHSEARHDAELSLGQKLYDYLRSLCPDIEPDIFLLLRID